MTNLKSLVTGMIFGGLAAGSAVLLVTPKSGEELRETARSRGREIGTMLSQLKEDGMALKNDIVTATKRSVPAVKEGVGGIKLSVDEWRKATEPDITALKKQIGELNDQMDKLEESAQKQPPSE